MREIRQNSETILPTLLFILLILAMPNVASSAVLTDKDWPRQIEVPKGTIIIYQPQLEMFNGVDLKCRSAISVTPKGSDRPSWGAMWFDARLLVDRDQRMASIQELKIPKARFTGSTPEQEKKLKAFIEEEVPKWNLSISLDRLLTGIQGSGRRLMAQDRLNDNPPRIIVSETPAVLVPINGGANLTKIESTNLMRVVNSIFQIVFDPAQNAYFLNGGSIWYAAQSLHGEWSPVNQAPEELTKFYTFWTRSDSTINSGASSAEDTPPRIIVSSEPAELIVFDGPPNYSPITGTNLFYAVNTGSDVFMDGKTNQVYVLLAGRWFRADSLAGPWQYVSADALPEGFSRIPADSPKRNVRVHVAGTELAQEAVLDTMIPQTAVISRRIATLKVTYDGEPVFKPIEGLNMQYAANADCAVINVNGKCYCCHNAIWYESEKPQGPWTVCISVPDIIYSMPPTCPFFNVKFVRILKATPETVCVGYTPGYVGCYRASSDTVVYGTGFTYPDWFQSQFIARPITWGLRARYNPLSGAWGLYADYISPTGKYRLIPGSVDGGGHHITKWSMAGWWGAGGYPNYQDMAGGGREQVKSNIYAKYAATAEAESITRHVNNIRFMEKKEVLAPKANPNNVYVDRLGDVYRRTDSGWQMRQGAKWVDVRATAAKTTSPLDAEYRSRQRGAERERQYDATVK